VERGNGQNEKDERGEKVLISPEVISGWRGHTLSLSVYTMRNIIDFVKNHPGYTCPDIYLGINNGNIPTDIDERKKGKQRTASVLNKLVKKGTLRGERSESDSHIRYWVVKNE
jgi:hypothetical protein